jgi:CRISPR-associated protein Cst2
MGVVQISVLAKISGNVNADEVVGTRITLKKMYSSSGEVLPFVSARAIKHAIRDAFKERGFDIDPFVEDPKAAETLRLRDAGDPEKYIDNDLFGYMVTTGRGETARRRQAPIAFSYLKALRDTPIKAEFAARFPRVGEKEKNPVPFEIEVAEFVGKVNCLIYDNVGKFSADELGEKEGKELDKDEREKRLRAFLEIFLTPSYVLPKRTNSLNIPDYILALVALSKTPAPIYQYLDFDFSKSMPDLDKLKELTKREDVKTIVQEYLIIDYFGGLPKIEGLEKVSVKDAISKITRFLL